MAAYLATALSPDLLAWEEANIGKRHLKEPFESEDFDDTGVSWFGQFQYDRYDWDDPVFAARNVGEHAYKVIPLTQGYFMIVSPHDYRRMTTFPNGSKKRWCADVKRDSRTGEIKGIYACRRGRGDEPRYIYAHRELIGCLEDAGVVDHLNGCGLDNRRGTQERPINLRYTSQSENMHNAVRSRTTSLALPRGVELRKKDNRGRQFYGGKYCKRFGKKVKTIRSKQAWLTPKSASRWYQRQITRLHNKRTQWAHNPDSVSYPVFPRWHADFVPF